MRASTNPTPPVPNPTIEYEKWRANTIEPQNPYATLNEIPEFLKCYSAASIEQAEQFDWTILNENELENNVNMFTQLQKTQVEDIVSKYEEFRERLRSTLAHRHH